MRKTFFFIVFHFICYTNGFCQDFQWAYDTKEISTYQGAGIRSIITDSQGNVYATGSFGGTHNFDENQTNNNNLTSSNSMYDGFILKLDKYKNFLWVKQILSEGNGRGSSIILDQNENVIITGITSGKEIDLNPDPTKQFIINNPTGNTGGFILKLNQNGEFIFGDFFPSYFAKESVIDNKNNIITIGNVGTSSSSNNKIFVIKNSSNGLFLWEKFLQGNNIFPHSLICDKSNNIIIKGNFMNNMVFSNKTYNSTLYSDFICKLDSDSKEIWYQKLGNTASAGISNEDKSIKIDNQNNIYFSTEYVGPFSVDFNGKTIQMLSNFGIESAIFKISPNGDPIWNVPIYGKERQETYSIAINDVGEIYALGFVNDETYVNNSLVYGNNQTGFLLKLSPSGNIADIKFIAYNGYSLCTDNESNILIGGFFNNQQDFDPDPSNQYLLSSFRGSGFLLKLGPCDSSNVVGANDQYFCSSSNPTISNISPNSSSIKWYDSINSTAPLSNTTPLLDGKKYYAARKNGNCPESTDRLEVTAHIASSPKAPSPLMPVFCKSDNAELKDLNIVGQNIKWYSNLIDATTIPIATLLQNDTTYYVSQSVNGCESERTAISVIIHNTTSPTTTSPQIFCIQQNATISSIAITGQNIKWYDALTNGNLLANTTLLQNGISYYASQTINGCESERTPILINIQNTLPPTAISSQTFCSSQNPTLNTVVISGTAIKWYDSPTAGINLPDSTPLQDGKTYYATQTLNGCESPTRLAITIALIATLPANNYDDFFCDDLNDGTETVDLNSYNSKVISNTSGYFFTYYNSISGAEKETVSDKIINFTSYKLALGENKIYVRINSNTTCYAVATLTLTLFAKPIINIQDIVPICENKKITIDAGAGFDHYLWSTGDKTQTITVENPGSFSITLTNEYGSFSCESTKNFEVKKSDKAIINSVETTDWTDNENTIVVKIAATNTGSYTYSLDGVNYQTSNQFSELSSGKYTVWVRDQFGCEPATKDVYLLMYPKFFTPNGDGYNDTWKIKFSDFETGLAINIFDLYGKLIKNLNTNTESWDGTYNGVQLPATDYWFVVTRANGQEYKGHFSLKR